MFVGQLGNTVRASIGRSFFEPVEVMRRLNQTTKLRLSKTGAWVRTRARTSIRKARRKRKPELTRVERGIYEHAVEKAQREGQEKPKIWWYAHSKPGEPPRSIQGFLRTHIYFVYEPKTRSVVVGPARLQGTSGEVPQALEQGGQVWSYRLKRNVSIKPRPFMRPALNAEAGNFPQLFRNSLRK